MPKAVMVIGAGPAGLYAAKKLANAGHDVALLNRDLRPGGLAEYGIFFNKYRMKAGLRKQYVKILNLESIQYFGGVTVGEDAPIRLAELCELGFDAVVVAVGAQGIKWIDVDGSHAIGVHDAKSLVYHYNGLPPFAQLDIPLGDELAIIGAGNVAVDIAHWAIHRKIPKVTFYVRRGPMQRKYTDKELAHIGGHVDRAALRAEVDRIADVLKAVGEDPDAVYANLTKKLGDDRIEGSDSVVNFRFACQPKRVLRDDQMHIRGMLLDVNELFIKGERVGCCPTGETENVSADMMVFAVGDKVDEDFGLATNQWGEYAVSASPDGQNSYEASDAPEGEPVGGVFVVGWARKASDGLVGKARKDAEIGVERVFEYLEGRDVASEPGSAMQRLRTLLESRTEFIDWIAFQKIRAVEDGIAEERGLDDFRFESDDEMRGCL
ncbi:MAG: ferredoxin--NADP+ reductase [Myxococcota bacterium]